MKKTTEPIGIRKDAVVGSFDLASYKILICHLYPLSQNFGNTLVEFVDFTEQFFVLSF